MKKIERRKKKSKDSDRKLIKKDRESKKHEMDIDRRDNVRARVHGVKRLEREEKKGKFEKSK